MILISFLFFVGKLWECMHMFSKMPLRNKIICESHFLFCCKFHNISSESVHGMDFQLILCVRNDLITYV